MKPILLIGLDPNMNREGMNVVMEQLRDQFPSYMVAVVAGMRYATVLEPERVEEPDPGPITPWNQSLSKERERTGK